MKSKGLSFTSALRCIVTDWDYIEGFVWSGGIFSIALSNGEVVDTKLSIDNAITLMCRGKDEEVSTSVKDKLKRNFNKLVWIIEKKDLPIIDFNNQKRKAEIRDTVVVKKIILAHSNHKGQIIESYDNKTCKAYRILCECNKVISLKSYYFYKV